MENETCLAEVISYFRSSYTKIRRAAFEQACDVEPSSQVLDALIDVFKDSEESLPTRLIIIKAIRAHGKDNSKAKKLLMESISRGNSINKVNVACAEALFYVGGDKNAALAGIILGLASSDSEVQDQAIAALISFGKTALPAVGLLANIINNEANREDFRGKALRVIGLLGTDAQCVSPTVAKCLLSPSAGVAFDAISTLEEIGVSAEALPDLLAALNYRDPTGQIRNRHPGFLFLGSLDMHETVVKLIGNLGSAAKSAIPILEELLQREISEEAAKQKYLAKLEEGGWSIGQRKRGRPKRMETYREDGWKTVFKFTSEKAKEAAQEAIRIIREEIQEPHE